MLPSALLKGHRSFLDNCLPKEKKRYEDLAENGQQPQVMVIGCVDSRVSPEVIFDATPGELLVVRNVANLVPAYRPAEETQHGTSAAIEFAVQALAVKHIVVLGHAHCGGIKAFATKQGALSPGDFIGRWMSQIAPAAESLNENMGDYTRYLRELEYASVRLSLNNLLTFPWIKQKVDHHQLQLHGAFFGIGTGQLLVLNQLSGRFEELAEHLKTAPSAP